MIESYGARITSIDLSRSGMLGISLLLVFGTVNGTASGHPLLLDLYPPELLIDDSMSRLSY